VLALGLAGLSWQLHRPQIVAVIRPALIPVTESLATTGRVSGAREALVSASAAGIVAQLFVREGDWVTAGAPLAALKSEVAAAQMAQAQAAWQTAQAQLQQVARAPLRSELDVATAHVQQARAQWQQQRNAVAQAEHAVAHARQQLSQSEAEQELAVRQFERSAQLARRGFIAQAAFDQAQASLRVAEAKVRAQQQAWAMARAQVRGAQSSVEVTLANVQAQEARLQTVQGGPRSEDIQVARRRVEEAEHALRVARQHAANALVTAPFAGLVTAINTEVGQTVGAQGVLKLVSRDVEIRVDVDESNDADLAGGQDVILSSNTFRHSTFPGVVAKIAASVDETRGTVTVTIVPITPPDWLRPGQTVNVNIITHPAMQRLLVPDSAIVRVGSSSGVLIVEDGQARPRTVLIRPPTAQGVPLLTGLTGHERVIINPQGIAPGDTVRVREARRKETS
jgi:HlyD family secretion protein